MRINNNNLSKITEIAKKHNVTSISMMSSPTSGKMFVEFRIDENNTIEAELYDDDSEKDKIVFIKKIDLKG